VKVDDATVLVDSRNPGAFKVPPNRAVRWYRCEHARRGAWNEHRPIRAQLVRQAGQQVELIMPADFRVPNSPDSSVKVNVRPVQGGQLRTPQPRFECHAVHHAARAGDREERLLFLDRERAAHTSPVPILIAAPHLSAKSPKVGAPVIRCPHREREEVLPLCVCCPRCLALFNPALHDPFDQVAGEVTQHRLAPQYRARQSQERAKDRTPNTHRSGSADLLSLECREILLDMIAQRPRKLLRHAFGTWRLEAHANARFALKPSREDCLGISAVRRPR
jgi:hypothetical protein